MVHFDRHPSRQRRPSLFTLPGHVRVPPVTPVFWVLKGLSTAMGEAASDFLVHALTPEAAVGLGFVAFAVALIIKMRAERYVAWSYWLAVAMVGVFGTMAADVLHVGFGVPYPASALLYVVVLVAVFATWYRTEGTLTIHAVDSGRRELFYWAAVVATFAMGTALGDLSAHSLGLGYFGSAALFAMLIAVPAAAFALGRWTPVVCFWTAYVITRPLGASLADGLGKPTGQGGLGLGDGVVAGVLVVLIAGLIVHVQRAEAGELDHCAGS